MNSLRVLLPLTILVTLCCQAPTAENGTASPLYNRLLATNNLLLRVVADNLSNHNYTKLPEYRDTGNELDIEVFETILSALGEEAVTDLSGSYTEFLTQLEAFDPRFYNGNYAESGWKSQSQIIKEFGTLSHREQRESLNINISHFLEHVLANTSTELTRNDEDIFVAVIPEKQLIQRNERYKAEIVIGQRMRTIKGTISLKSWDIPVLDGGYNLNLIPPRTPGEGLSVENLDMAFQTTINGKDTLIQIKHEYYIID